MSTQEAHEPVLWCNLAFHRGGAGVYSYYGCTCGQAPAEIPQRDAERARWYHRHRADLGLPPVHSLARAVYAPGYPAAGKTWAQWRRTEPGVNPFTAEAYRAPNDRTG